MTTTLPLTRRPAPSRVIQNFTPNWFTVTMGTGILSLTLPHLPLPGTVATGEGLWALNMLLLSVFTLLSLARLLRYPRECLATLHHPVHSMFLGAVPMGLATVINGFVTFGLPLWGQGAAVLARDLWVFDALLSAGVGLLVPYLMFTRQDHSLSRMSAIWLLPVVASEVAAASAGLIAPHLKLSAAEPLVYAGYVLFALSVPLALMLITVLVLRLAQHNLPGAELGVSMFLPLGPLATGALALLQLGEAAPRILAAQGLGAAAPVALGAGLIGGLLLWGFGAWWLALASLTTLRFLRQGLPFNLGWWGLTFPLGVFIAATFSLGALTHLTFFTTLGNLLVVVLAALWLLVAARTAHGAWHGHLLPDPATAQRDRPTPPVSWSANPEHDALPVGHRRDDVQAQRQFTEAAGEGRVRVIGSDERLQAAVRRTGNNQQQLRRLGASKEGQCPPGHHQVKTWGGPPGPARRRPL